MLLLILIGVNFLIYVACSATPVQSLQLSTIQPLLISIEERLKNLDNICSIQHDGQTNSKLDQFSRKLEILDNKLYRLEMLTNLQLDKISENISSKNFKDDIAKTNLNRKIDAIYEGIMHRLAYFENKFETSSSKMQIKIDGIQTKISKMEDSLTTRDADIEAELADTVNTIDELKNTCNTIEERIITSNKELLNKTNEENIKVTKDNNIQFKNINRKLDKIEKQMENNFNLSKNAAEVINVTKNQIRQDINDYVTKVEDLYIDTWKSTNKTDSTIQKLETTLNTTHLENQNSFRSLMVQFGKLASKENDIKDAPTDVERMNQKLDMNFEKLFLKQDLFLESCYKLQNDESQIEIKISEILEKLVDTMERKTTLQPKDLKTLEQMVKSHDAVVRRNLHNLGNNFNSLGQKLAENSGNLYETMSDVLNKMELQNNGSNSTETTYYATKVRDTRGLFLKPYSNDFGQINKILPKISNDEAFYESLTKKIDSINEVTNSIKKNEILETIKNMYKKVEMIDRKLSNQTFHDEKIDFLNTTYATNVLTYFSNLNETEQITSTENDSDIIANSQEDDLIIIPLPTTETSTVKFDANQETENPEETTNVEEKIEYDYYNN